MKPDWLSDGRLIPDEVMSYLRKIAVHAVEEMGCSPEDVIKILGLSLGWRPTGRHLPRGPGTRVLPGHGTKDSFFWVYNHTGRNS